MNAVIQCVTDASVDVQEERVAQIECGFCVLLGVARSDTDEDATWMARKIARLRVFPDQEGRTNFGLSEIGGAVLLVSQFTLLGDCAKGNRPSFIDAAPPQEARRLYQSVAGQLADTHGIRVETGRFQEHMIVRLSNNGPFTVLLDSTKR